MIARIVVGILLVCVCMYVIFKLWDWALFGKGSEEAREKAQKRADMRYARRHPVTPPHFQRDPRPKSRSRGFS